MSDNDKYRSIVIRPETQISGIYLNARNDIKTLLSSIEFAKKNLKHIKDFLEDLDSRDLKLAFLNNRALLNFETKLERFETLKDIDISKGRNLARHRKTLDKAIDEFYYSVSKKITDNSNKGAVSAYSKKILQDVNVFLLNIHRQIEEKDMVDSIEYGIFSNINKKNIKNYTKNIIAHLANFTDSINKISEVLYHPEIINIIMLKAQDHENGEIVGGIRHINEFSQLREKLNIKSGTLMAVVNSANDLKDDIYNLANNRIAAGKIFEKLLKTTLNKKNEAEFDSTIKLVWKIFNTAEKDFELFNEVRKSEHLFDKADSNYAKLKELRISYLDVLSERER